MTPILAVAIALSHAAWATCPIPSFQPPMRPDSVLRTQLLLRGRSRLDDPDHARGAQLLTRIFTLGRPEATCRSSDGQLYTATPGCPADRKIGETIPVLDWSGMNLLRGVEAGSAPETCGGKQLREFRAWVALGGQRPALRAGLDQLRLELLDARAVQGFNPPSFDEVERIRSARSNGGRTYALEAWEWHHRQQVRSKLEAEERYDHKCTEFEDLISPDLHERIGALKDGYGLERAELIEAENSDRATLVLRPTLYADGYCNVITRAELDSLFWINEVGPMSSDWADLVVW